MCEVLLSLSPHGFSSVEATFYIMHTVSVDTAVMLSYGDRN